MISRIFKMQMTVMTFCMESHWNVNPFLFFIKNELSSLSIWNESLNSKPYFPWLCPTNHMLLNFFPVPMIPDLEGSSRRFPPHDVFSGIDSLMKSIFNTLESPPSLHMTNMIGRRVRSKLGEINDRFQPHRATFSDVLSRLVGFFPLWSVFHSLEYKISLQNHQ